MPPHKAKKAAAQDAAEVAAKWFSDIAPDFAKSTFKTPAPKSAVAADSKTQQTKRPHDDGAVPVKKTPSVPAASKKTDKEKIYVGTPGAMLSQREKENNATEWFNELAKKMADAKKTTGAKVLLSERPDVWDAVKDESKRNKRKTSKFDGLLAHEDVANASDGDDGEDEEKEENEDTADEEGAADAAEAGAAGSDDDDDVDSDIDGDDGGEGDVVMGGADESAYERTVAPTAHRLQLVESHRDKLEAIQAFMQVYREQERLAGKREKSRVLIFVSDYKVARVLEGMLGRRIVVHRKTHRAFTNVGVDVRVRGIASLHEKLLEWQSKLNERRFRAGKATTMITTDECAGPLWPVRHKVGLVIHCDVPAGQRDALSVIKHREDFVGRPRFWFPESTKPAEGAPDERKNEVFMVLNATNANKCFAGDYAPVMAKKAARVAQALTEFASTRNRKPLA